ncbi:hypothetical protein P0F65_02220 [Sphingomonas sp. I4]
MRQPLLGIGDRMMQDGRGQPRIERAGAIVSNRFSDVPQRFGSPSASQKNGLTQCRSRISATSAGEKPSRGS